MGGYCSKRCVNPWIPWHDAQFKVWEAIERQRQAKFNASQTVVDNINRDIAMVNQIYNDIAAAARAFSRAELRDNIQRYLNSPVTDFIKSYDPSYISNNNTIYLRITSLDRATNTVSDLDNQVLTFNKPPQSIYDIMEEDTTYEETVYIDNFDPNDYFYEPEGGNLEMSKDADKLIKVITYNSDNQLIKTYNQFGEIDIKKDFSFTEQEIIYSLDIAPGTKVSIKNGKGITVSYDNSSQATDFKRVNLDSSMRASRECIMNSKTTDEIFNCIVTGMTISKN